MRCPHCGGQLELHTDGHYSPFGKTVTLLKQRAAWIYQCAKCTAQVFIPMSPAERRGERVVKKQKVYALSQDKGIFRVYATFYGHHPGLNEREEAVSWLDSNGSNLAREMGSVREDRASVSGCYWDFKTAKKANAFGRKLDTCAPPCVTVMLGDAEDEKDGK